MRMHAYRNVSNVSAVGAIELITHRVRRTLTLYSLSPAKIDRKHQLWPVSRLLSNQKQMSRPVSSYQQRRRGRCAVRAAADGATLLRRYVSNTIAPRVLSADKTTSLKWFCDES